MRAFAVWRKITIPAHAGGEDLIGKVRGSGMHVEYWAEALFKTGSIAPRVSPENVQIIRIRNADFGFQSPLVSIAETKKTGRSLGLRFLTLEEILALRLAYHDQPLEWLRIAMKTYVDDDGSALDIAIVNDGSRRDLRTTWGFEQNVYQLAHEWFWVLPE